MHRFLLFLAALSSCISLFAQGIDEAIHNTKLIENNGMYNRLYIHTDQTMVNVDDLSVYNQAIWFRLYTANAENKPTITAPYVTIQFLNPKGDVVQNFNINNAGTELFGSVPLTTDMVAGIYTLRAQTPKMQLRGTYVEKEITIHRTVLPQLLMELEMERASYTAGSKGGAYYELRALDGAAIAKQELISTVQLNGQVHQIDTLMTDEEGKAFIPFELPENLTKADALLLVQTRYNDRVESISRSIPVLLDKIAVQFMPEGGDIVAGMNNRVAFRAIDQWGKPAEIAGKLYAGSGNLLGSFDTYHDGMGSFDLLADKDAEYYILLDAPVNNTDTFYLPKTMANPVGMRLMEQDEKQLVWNIYSINPQKLEIVGMANSNEVVRQSISVKAGNNTVEINTEDFPIGISQFTIIDAKKRPHAERLVFLNKHRQINVIVSSNKETYLPREKVTLDIEAKDEQGNPVEGSFSLAVVDDNLHTFANDRQDNILSGLLLSEELMGDIYKPDFYFDKEEEKADMALDYVMLTHGWRRFTWNEMLGDGQADWNERLAALIHQSVNGRLTPYNYYSDNSTIKQDNQRIYWTNTTDVNSGIRQPRKKDIMGETKSNDDGSFTLFLPDTIGYPITLWTDYRGFKARATAYEYNSIYINPQSFKALEGQVTNENGVPLPLAKVTLYYKGLKWNTIYTDMKGKWELPPLASYQYDVSIECAGYETQWKEVNASKNNAELNMLTQLEVSDARYGQLLWGMEEAIVVNKTVLTTDKKESEEDVDVDGIVDTEDQVTLLDGSYIVVQNEFEHIPFVEGEADVVQYLEALPGTTASSAVSQDVVITSDRLMSSEVSLQAVAGVAISYYSAPSDRYTIAGESYNMPSSPLGYIQLDYNYNYNNYYYGYNNYNATRQFYAPAYSKEDKVTDRTDFRSTVYWNPAIRTNAKGKAKVEYHNSDATTTIRAIIEGQGKEGTLGRSEMTYAVEKPFAMTVSAPSVVQYGDSVVIAIGLSNQTDEPIEGQLMQDYTSLLSNIDAFDIDNKTYTVSAQTTEWIYIPYVVPPQEGILEMSYHFNALGYQDAVKESMRIESVGIPRSDALSGMTTSATKQINMSNAIKGTKSAVLEVYTSEVDELMVSLEGMLRMPSGCFEQVSSTNYPNIMALQAMDKSGYIRPDIRQQSLEYLKTGYKKLTGYKTAEGGYSLYGRLPANTRITAYGLIQFYDMQKVYDGVEQKVIDNTAQWLVKKLTKNGKWTGDAYTSWIMTETGFGAPIAKDIFAKNKEMLKNNQGYYNQALWALANQNLGNEPAAQELLASIIEDIGVSENLDEVPMSATAMYSGGYGQRVEVLSMVMLALMRSSDPDIATIERLAYYITGQRRNGYFGSTQATAMALRALSSYYENYDKGQGSGVIYAWVNGNKVEVPFDENMRGLLRLNLSEHLINGINEFKVEFEDEENMMAYSLRTNWSVYQLEDDETLPLDLDIEWGATEATLGDIVRMNVHIQNASKEQVHTPMVRLGLPSGLSLQAWQLKEWQEKNGFDYYEVKENYLYLYYTSFEAGEERDLYFDLKADVAGNYMTAASSIYPYYHIEKMKWVTPEYITVSTK